MESLYSNWNIKISFDDKKDYCMEIEIIPVNSKNHKNHFNSVKELYDSLEVVQNTI